MAVRGARLENSGYFWQPEWGHGLRNHSTAKCSAAEWAKEGIYSL